MKKQREGCGMTNKEILMWLVNDALENSKMDDNTYNRVCGQISISELYDVISREEADKLLMLLADKKDKKSPLLKVKDQ